MERHTLQDLCNIHNYLSQVKKPSGEIKKALAGLEKRICATVESMYAIGPIGSA